MTAKSVRKHWVLNPFSGALVTLNVFRRRVGKRMYLVFALALAAGLAEGIGISLLLPLLAALDIGYEAGQSVPDVLAWLVGAIGIEGSLAGMLLMIATMFILKGVLVFGHRGYTGYLNAQLLRELKGDLFAAYGRMDYDYYASRNTGHFVNVITVQVDRFLAAFMSFNGFLTRVLQSTAYLLFAMLLAWQFGLMMIAVGLLVLAMFAGLNRHVRTLSRLTSTETGYLNKLLVQTMQAFKYLTSTHGTERVANGVYGSVRRVTDYQMRQQLWSAFTGSISEPISVLMILLIIGIQVGFFQQPLAPILVAIVLFYRGMSQLLQVQSLWQNTLNNMGAVDMVEDECKALETHREKGGERIIGPLQHGIELNNVSFSYSSEVAPALRDISLIIPARSTVALVGESGAGKSTFVDLLTLVLKPQSGQILIDDVPGSEIRLDSWRKQIGYVSQETVIFDDTIAGNIALMDGDPTIDTDVFDRVREAVERAHLTQFVDSLPNGYQTVVGDRGIRLSGGQRQRLFIARELYKSPKLLILDEATSALDTESEQAIQASIDELHGSMTVVIIAHRLSTIRNVDHVFVLGEGRLVEHGPYEELRDADRSRFKRLLALQRL